MLLLNMAIALECLNTTFSNISKFDVQLIQTFGTRDYANILTFAFFFLILYKHLVLEVFKKKGLTYALIYSDIRDNNINPTFVKNYKILSLMNVSFLD